MCPTNFAAKHPHKTIIKKFSPNVYNVRFERKNYVTDTKIRHFWKLVTDVNIRKGFSISKFRRISFSREKESQ